MSVQRAAKWYEDFREKRATRARKITIRWPETVASMGECLAVIYRTTHGTKVVHYKHKFRASSRPLLCTDGKRLYLIGGRYHVTDRGIVDLTSGGREVDDGAGHRKRRR